MLSLKTLASLAISVSLLGLISCSTTQDNTPQYGNTDTLIGLQAMGQPVSRSQSGNIEKKKIRYQAIQDTAMSLGAQAGLSWQSKNIDASLDTQSETLEKIYAFNALILDNNVLPPVLLEGRNIMNQADGGTIRISDRRYKILRQAQFVTVAPNWRQYLWMDYTQPARPDDTLLPQDAYEQQIWDYYSAIGWQEGMKQANEIFTNNVARLKEDFTGMILYRKLLAQNMVSPPFVAHTDLGVTGDSAEINIDDRVLRITALPALNTDSQEWNAVVAQNQKLIAKYNKMAQIADKDTILSLSDEPTGGNWRPMITNASNNE